MTEFLQNLAGGMRVMIDLCGHDEEGGKVQFTTEGLLFTRENTSLLVYEEVNPDDMTAAQSVIRFDESSVCVVRGSEPFSAMEFHEGRLCESEYRAEGQSLMLRVFPTEVTVKLRGARGHLRIVYQVTLGLLGGAMQETGVRRLDVRFRPAGSAVGSRAGGKRSSRANAPVSMPSQDAAAQFLQEIFPQDKRP